MIAHISPADRQRDESRNTLVYADRAKNISNKVSQLIERYFKIENTIRRGLILYLRNM